VFPVLFSMVCFMNEVLVIAGSVVTFVILVTKFVIVLVTSANLVEENLIVIGIFCLAITIFGGCRSVKLIVTYSNEDADIIKAKAAQQHETAVLVEEIVNELDDEFHGLVDELTSINSSITNSNDVIDRIAGGSESTADAAIRQTEMTNEIQERLENTSEIADSAMTTADDVKNVVMDGKLQSDELSHQSQVVDESTAKISETITKLVENVSKVSEITDTILAISAQTNLLALNASIEAARAGEAGKGFAVVADEIRDLAEKTKESTESITTIVNQLIAVTDETKRGLDISVESINVQREKVREVTESFATVENGITEVYGGMQTVYSEVTAVLNANQSIVDGITTLSAVSEEISAETQTSKDEMDNILTSMSRFSEVMDGTFQKLQSLKETTTLTEEDE
ncbi:MAG: hypothetical protein HUJ70_03310, partial [Pseudobutyrivibrio sp.]|nr:hypothetical protein [Pseudobutyrivibrio sp.]